VPKPTTYVIWHDIEEQFHNNELHRAVYLEAEFCNLVQGDMDIAHYTGRLKQLSDSLRDVRQPVSKTSQVLNLLRGLSSKYRHAVPVITAKQLPHTFLSARSYLLLEEHYDKEQAKSVAQHALLTTGGPRSAASTPGDGGSNSGFGGQTSSNSGFGGATPAYKLPANAHGTTQRSDNRRSCGRGRGRGGHHGGSGGSSTPRPPMGCTSGLNP
jgi:hypothetical protein